VSREIITKEYLQVLSRQSLYVAKEDLQQGYILRYGKGKQVGRYRYIGWVPVDRYSSLRDTGTVPR
jgi:stage III sporulation protein SpoIIIAA